MPAQMRSSAARLLGAGLIAAAALSAASADIKQFRDWIAACDNLRACSAYGFDVELSGNTYIRLERAGAAEAPLRITIAVDAQRDVKFRLAFDDPALAGLPSAPVTGEATGDDDELKRLTISEPQAVAAALASLRKAKTLVVTRIDPANAPASDPVKSEISLSGLAAALLWIDDQQKRVGTVTALIGRGDKPAAAVPVVPALPVVTAATRPNGPVPKKAPAAVIAKARAVCEDKKLGEPDAVARLDANAVMYSFVCTRLSGAYNSVHALVIDSPGKLPRVAEFKFPRDFGANVHDETVVNPGFDGEVLMSSYADVATMVMVSATERLLSLFFVTHLPKLMQRNLSVSCCRGTCREFIASSSFLIV